MAKKPGLLSKSGNIHFWLVSIAVALIVMISLLGCRQQQATLPQQTTWEPDLAILLRQKPVTRTDLPLEFQGLSREELEKQLVSIFSDARESDLQMKHLETLEGHRKAHYLALYLGDIKKEWGGYTQLAYSNLSVGIQNGHYNSLKCCSKTVSGQKDPAPGLHMKWSGNVTHQ